MSINFKQFKNKFFFLPVGGCDGIGINFYLYHYNGKWIAIDCGIGFPNNDKTPGTEIMIPDLSFFITHNIKLSALIITHAHEDHIGAICDLYHYLKCPIYATTFSKNVIHYAMKNANIQEHEIDIKEIEHNKYQFKIEDFKIEMIPITHSIVEASMIFIETAKGKIIHTGDWRIDTKPVVGAETDVKRIKELCKNGISALICDSTNAYKDKKNQPEADLESSIYNEIKNHKGLIVVTSFASSISRIKIIYNISKKLGKKLVLSGRSMEKMIVLAKQSGYLKDIEFYTAREAKDFKRNDILILATGSQGEELATVSKLAHNKHHYFQLKAGDTIVFSSMTIPGNEMAVNKIINQLIASNIKVITKNDLFVHVSGHPYQSDLKKMYEWTRTKGIIPVHGEWFMLIKHLEFATQCGIKNGIFTKNGDIIEISDKELQKIGHIKVTAKCVDGARFIDQDSEIFQERVEISKNGIILCNITLHNNGTSFTCKTVITSKGLFEKAMESDTEIMKNLENIINKKIKISNENEMKKQIEDIIKKEIYFQTLKKPMIEIFIQQI